MIVYLKQHKTDMALIDKETIRKEIERMREINKKALELGHITEDMYHGRTQAQNGLLAFLDTLQEPNIELIQRSWYMEGYIDGKNKREPKWVIKTGEGGPRHELNPRYGEPIQELEPEKLSVEDANGIYVEIKPIYF